MSTLPLASAERRILEHGCRTAVRPSSDPDSQSAMVSIRQPGVPSFHLSSHCETSGSQDSRIAGPADPPYRSPATAIDERHRTGCMGHRSRRFADVWQGPAHCVTKNEHLLSRKPIRVGRDQLSVALVVSEHRSPSSRIVSYHGESCRPHRTVASKSGGLRIWVRTPKSGARW